MLWTQQTREGIRFKIRVQPRASKDEIIGLVDDALKVRLTSPPVDGQANEACLRFFARALDIPKSHVRLVVGETSRTKTLEVKGVELSKILDLFDN